MSSCDYGYFMVLTATLLGGRANPTRYGSPLNCRPRHRRPALTGCWRSYRYGRVTVELVSVVCRLLAEAGWRKAQIRLAALDGCRIPRACTASECGLNRTGPLQVTRWVDWRYLFAEVLRTVDGRCGGEGALGEGGTMDGSTIGTRIKQLRGNTMTQRELAEHSGVSLSLIRALEQDQRLTASIPTLHKLARALDTDPGVLLGKITNIPGSPDAGVMALRRALTPVDDLLDESALDGEPVADDEARRLVEYGWGLYWSGRYDTLTAMLPSALTQLRATAYAAALDRRAVSQELLARGYWLTACSLVHLGQQEAAWLAIRQALAAAKDGSDALLDAVLRGSVSWQLLVQGRYDEAARVAEKAAESVEPAGDARPDHVSVYGSLLISAATSAGRMGLGDRADGLLAEAAVMAGRNGADRTDYESPFGPAQVAMQTVDVAVVTEQYGRAVEAAKAMPRDAALPLAARARHVTDVAFALANLGQVERARDALLTVEQMAPAWIKYQTLPRQVAAELVRRNHDAALRGLARRLGVVAT